MPVTLLEAMAAGLPVVATDVGGIASVVHDGITGTLVPAGDPRALACVLKAYVMNENLRHQHGEAGRARVATEFSLSAMVSAYAALYDELLMDLRVQRTNPPVGLAERREH
jgi:glycosyltransferase involved in cell wall biosynthesis